MNHSRHLLLIFLILASAGGFADLLGQMLGAQDLSTRRFDQVAFLSTHNSYNVRKLHRLPNQNLTVAEQLELGVRGFMLDVYWKREKAVVYHGSPMLKKRPLQEDLSAMHDFLAAHPEEVVSIIFESYLTDDQLHDALQAAGLLPYLHVQPKDSIWPTLKEMTAADHQLVVFSEGNRGSAYPWLHHVWDYSTENRWSNHARRDFDWKYNRGDSTRQLYLLNHFITHRKFGYGLKDSALVANSKGNILTHAIPAWSHTGHFPNFVALDFVDLGQGADAVAELNSLWEPTEPLGTPMVEYVMNMTQENKVYISLLKPLTSLAVITVRDPLVGAVVLRSEIEPGGATGISIQLKEALRLENYQVEIRSGDQFQVLTAELGIAAATKFLRKLEN
ncbi:MAG: hypothetical protein U0176_17320 [Bacteroidia bacterium]